MKLFKTVENENVAATLGNVAFIYGKLGKLDKALEINQKVLSK